MTNSDALDCIRSAGFYDSPAYRWARALVDAVLADSFDDETVARVLDSICRRGRPDNPSSASPQPRTNTAEDAKSLEPPFCVSRIRSLDAIENVGLVHRDSPIELRDGLTVFYGKNAAGKSSIFSALANTLGVSKRAAPNLGGTDQNLACTITVDVDGENKELRWSGKAMPLAGLPGDQVTLEIPPPYDKGRITFRGVKQDRPDGGAQKRTKERKRPKGRGARR